MVGYTISRLEALMEAKAAFVDWGTEGVSMELVCESCKNKCRQVITMPLQDVEEKRLHDVRWATHGCVCSEKNGDYCNPYFVRHMTKGELLAKFGEDQHYEYTYGSTHTDDLDKVPPGTRYTYVCTACKGRHCTFDTPSIAPPLHCMVKMRTKKLKIERTDIYEV